MSAWSDDVLCTGCEQHLVVEEASALAWALLQGHVGGGSLAVEPHRVEGRSLEVRAAPGSEQFLLFHKWKKKKLHYKFFTYDSDSNMCTAAFSAIQPPKCKRLAFGAQEAYRDL